MALTGKAADKFQEWIDSQMYDRFVSQASISEIDPICLEALEAEFLNTFNYGGTPLFELSFINLWEIRTYGDTVQSVTSTAIKAAGMYYNNLMSCNQQSI